MEKEKNNNFEFNLSKVLNEKEKKNMTAILQLSLWITILVITAVVLILAYNSSSNFDQVSHKYLKFFIITVFYAGALIMVRGWFVRSIVFMYKSKIMEIYYNKFSPGETIPVSDNGNIIGTLEGFLYALGVFIKSVAFIGIILGIRSYVAVKSHNNKEESEFYIMGMMGSLFASLTITGIYILVVYTFLDINILDKVAEFLPSTN